MSEQKEYIPLRDVDTVITILNKISIFAALSRKQLQVVLELLQKVSYAQDEAIYEKGDQPSHIYIIQKGEVKIILEKGEDTFELVAFGEGQCFGQTAVIAIEPHAASAVTSRATDLIVLTRDALLSIFKKDKELFSILILNIAREACRRLHKTDEILLHYINKKQ